MITFKSTIIHPEEILLYLKKNIQLKEICQRICYQRIMEQAADARGVQVTPLEIQTVADQQRYEKRLFQASDTFAWLNDQGITAEDWEAGIRDRLLADQLAQQLFAAEVQSYFAEHRADFDQVLLYQIVVPYQKLAQEIVYEIQEGEISFYEAAHIYDVDAERRSHCGFAGRFYRWNLHPDISAIVFSTPPGQVIGPFIIDDASHVLLVEERVPSELTPERYQEILQRMFNEWLATELNYQTSP